MRKKIVAGNWKMNKTIDEAVALTSEVVNMIKDEVSGQVEVILCVPSLYLTTLKKYIPKAPIKFRWVHKTATKSLRVRTRAKSRPQCLKPSIFLTLSSATASGGNISAKPTAQLAEKVNIALENGSDAHLLLRRVTGSAGESGLHRFCKKPNHRKSFPPRRRPACSRSSSPTNLSGPSALA